MKSEKPYGLLPFCENHMPGKNLVLERAKRAKVGGAVRRIGSKISISQHNFSLVHYISMKPSRTVVGIKRVKTDM